MSWRSRKTLVDIIEFFILYYGLNATGKDKTDGTDE